MGAVIGTIPYMSPEQANGNALDARSDIYSFGVVLYQALFGRRPFPELSGTTLLAAIVLQEPEPLGPHLPSELRFVVSKAMEKDPCDRYESMREMVVDLRRFACQREAVPPRRAAWPWAIGVATLLTLAFLAFRLCPVSAAPIGDIRVQRLTDFTGMEESLALSPDGRTVAFIARVGNFRQIWIRLQASGTPLQITKDEVDHEQPRRSPDSSSLLYYSPLLRATSGWAGRAVGDIGAGWDATPHCRRDRRWRHQSRWKTDRRRSI